jgi:2-C-methyl-D-erythritol 4-phosphate cytidylyltransferase
MNVAIVVAAGKGTRLGGDRPKQFLEIGGIPIVIHTLRQFELCREINEVVTVLPMEETDAFLSLAKSYGLKKPTLAVAGGASRAQSVARGLAEVNDAEIVAVHDGVRPFVMPHEIDRVVGVARDHGAAILVAPVPDTIKEIKHERVFSTLPRANLRRALTPQCFRLEILKRAYETLSETEASGSEMTDDSSLVERLGVEIVAVEGSSRNIKITREEDLALAEVILRQLSVVSSQ